MSLWTKISATVAIGNALLLVGSGPLAPPSAHAGSFFRNQAVGGISIDVDGVVGQPNIEARVFLRERMLASVKPTPGQMAQATELRKISLRRLEAAVADVLNGNAGDLPDELKYLAGIQRIRFVFVYPEQNDVVLAGPGEGWKVDEYGHVVGVTTGRPVIHIDDLLVSLRSAAAARQGGITCSIDPTTEGLRAVQAFLRKQHQFQPGVIPRIENILGPQNVTVRGIPTDSHFARVLVACDYRMKRIAMNLEPSPVKDLPGFLDLIKSRRGGPNTMTPRWWLACNYEPLTRSEDGMAWELRGPGVKAMTEQDFLTADGSLQHTGKADPVAQQWADLMTQRYEDLADVDLVFGQLRNLMDLCVIGALIQREQLLEKADCPLPLLTRPDSELMTEAWIAAKTVATQCSFVKKRRNYVITASGGVRISSWRVIERTRTGAEVGRTRQRATAPAQSAWWWN